MATPFGSETVGVVAKLWLKVGFEDGSDDLLQQLVAPRWNAQGALCGGLLLGDVGAPCWCPSVSLVSEGVDEMVDFGDGHTIHGLGGCTGRHRAVICIQMGVCA